MTETDSQINGGVADAAPGNWVDRRAPAWSRPYLRLSRADRPIGTWLLLIPCWWGLLLAMGHTGTASWHDAWIGLGCALGAWLMRGAGCTWNDITDREFDGAVERTKSRPIPSGQVTARQALGWAVLQSLLAFLILLTFHPVAIALGIGSLSLAPVARYAAGIAWTLFYDTIYAHQDKEDDALIGVKSTARLFGANTHRWLRWFLVATLTLFLLAIVLAAPGNILTLTISICGVWAMGWHLAWQLTSLDPDDSATCLRLFRSNRDAGLIPAAFLALALFA